MNDRSSMAPITRQRPPIRGAQRIRLLIADDHALLRQALRVLLEAQEGLHKGAGAPGGPPPGAPRGVPGAPGGPGAPGATPSPSTPAPPETPRGGTQGPRLGITVAADAGGVRVDAVVPRSPADTAGVKVGDLITAANDKPTASVEDLQAIVADAGFGSSVKLAIMRDGKPTTVTVRIGARPIPTRPSA